MRDIDREEREDGKEERKEEGCTRRELRLRGEGGRGRGLALRPERSLLERKQKRHFGA